MRSMSPWKPWEIAELTPLQFLCLCSDKPPGTAERAPRSQMGLLYRDGKGPDEP
jgi:hypothetical protein